jgi:tetratricopeptide (TPR) repeat protein
VNDAEWLRRGEQPDQALERYDAAAEFFRRAQALEPSYADTCEHYLSMCALGRGFAHLLAGRRDAAVEALLEAVELRPQVATQRDGLNREPLDLIDGALEWNWNGESPVDPVALADALAAADPQDPFWPRAVADAELREGLRAYGRSEPEAGMAHLRRSLEIAPRALALVDDEENRALVAQSATVVAEALLDADAELVEVRALLARAAELQGLTAPADEAPREALEALRGELRELLGPARPAFRPGR